MTGTHIIIDVSNILDNEKLKYSTSIFPIMDKIIEQFQLKVVAKASHQFDPFGFTGVYVLSESHLSIHTFVEERKLALDLYTCYFFDYSKELYEMMKNEFGEECEIKLNVIKRN
jgi:S-adenosylmethionine decarboxylase